MSEGLFRKEAVEFATQRLYGHVIVLPKLSHVLALVFLMLCVALFVTTLLVGQRVEQQSIAGELRIRGDGGATAELFLPASMAHRLSAGDKLFLTASGFAPDSIGRIEAVVTKVAPLGAIRPPTESELGQIYIPATLAIGADALRSAGLPRMSETTLRVETRLVVRTESWFRWLLNALGTGDVPR